MCMYCLSDCVYLYVERGGVQWKVNDIEGKVVVIANIKNTYKIYFFYVCVEVLQLFPT